MGFAAVRKDYQLFMKPAQNTPPFKTERHAFCMFLLPHPPFGSQGINQSNPETDRQGKSVCMAMITENDWISKVSFFT
jgi:hypothetical protein